MSSKYRVSVSCPCGGSFTLHSKADHFRTMRHQEYENPTNSISVADFVISNLDRTNDEKDYISSSTLYNMFNNKNITRQKFKNDLLVLGIVSKRKNSGMAYIGIKNKN